MEFDNKKTAIRIYLRKMIIAIVTAVLLATILVSGWFDKDVLGFQKYTWVILVTVVYVLTVVVSRLRRLNFFFFSDQGNEILIRYYPIHPLVQKKKAIRIPKIGLAGYDIERPALGLSRTIVLRQKVKGKVASYPPIGITSLKKSEVELISSRLDAYVRT